MLTNQKNQHRLWLQIISHDSHILNTSKHFMSISFIIFMIFVVDVFLLSSFWLLPLLMLLIFFYFHFFCPWMRSHIAINFSIFFIRHLRSSIVFFIRFFFFCFFLLLAACCSFILLMLFMNRRTVERNHHDGETHPYATACIWKLTLTFRLAFFSLIY